ncbi:phosphoribosylanthranilate isomerase [Leptolyngbya sp. FACHB-36]|uniref:phosphoribosylanthranilate isomerase n=1 Tax=Leptolyngbya sp. FACHB-36 TaxID=2692808 RepID=UPI001680F588|nr:phosphoribosylanthranilate isomerase [Leptolyngbya sp. FACHB-36]
MGIKICGITQVAQGRSIAELGATALGFICVPGTPRYCAPKQIQAIVAELPLDADGQPVVDRVGVFLNQPLEDIYQTVRDCDLNGIQLHGTESPEFCQQIRTALPTVKLIKALRVRNAEVLTEASDYVGAIDALLLDAYDPKLPGGTGKTLDWTALQQFRPFCPWFLSGGLTPDNVLDALRLVVPYGIDLSSGVERAPGDKDLQKVAQLFRNLCFESD